MNTIKEIVIDPRCKFNYATYYLLGLEQAGIKWRFGKIDSFNSIMANHQDYTRGFGMLIYKKDGGISKVYLDNHDDNDILERAYEWCDVYATVNIDERYLKEKVFPIGPSCGLKIYSLPKLLWYFAINSLKIYRSRKLDYKPSIKEFLHDYLYSVYRRLPYAAYETKVENEKDYCFAISTLWADGLADKETNTKRYWFIKACSKLIKNFEGGFFFNKSVEGNWDGYSSYLKKYEGLIYQERIPLSQYIKKTKRSVVVFNTPAVGMCLGWKLAEYLMMGKAIISTPIGNVMPGEFNAGEHYFLAKDEKGISEGIQLLNVNDKLRKKYELNAHHYFNEYLSPEKVVDRIIKRIR